MIKINPVNGRTIIRRGGKMVKIFRFQFNTEYARALRDAVNDRQKQSLDNVHQEKRDSQVSILHGIELVLQWTVWRIQSII